MVLDHDLDILVVHLDDEHALVRCEADNCATEKVGQRQKDDQQRGDDVVRGGQVRDLRRPVGECRGGEGALGDALLAPTRIYVAAALALARRGAALGFAAFRAAFPALCALERVVLREGPEPRLAARIDTPGGAVWLT